MATNKEGGVRPGLVRIRRIHTGITLAKYLPGLHNPHAAPCEVGAARQLKLNRAVKSAWQPALRCIPFFTQFERMRYTSRHRQSLSSQHPDRYASQRLVLP